jgi:hypothetical protein
VSPLRQFLAVEGSAILALLAVAGLLGAAGFASEAGQDEAGRAAAAFFAASAVVGAPFVVLYGAPTYWALLRHDNATLPFVLFAGVAPGIACLIASTGLGLVVGGCGAAVAALTHWIYGRFASSRAAPPASSPPPPG